MDIYLVIIDAKINKKVDTLKFRGLSKMQVYG